MKECNICTIIGDDVGASTDIHSFILCEPSVCRRKVRDGGFGGDGLQHLACSNTVVCLTLKDHILYYKGPKRNPKPQTLNPKPYRMDFPRSELDVFPALGFDLGLAKGSWHVMGCEYVVPLT